MAKKSGRRRGSRTGQREAGMPETVGSALGSVMAKVDAWMAQREEIASELRAAADRIMSGESPFPWRKSGQASLMADGGMVSSGTKAHRRRKMSAEAREKIATAQRARWARQKGEAGGAAKAAKSAKTSKRGRNAKKAGDHVGNG